MSYKQNYAISKKNSGLSVKDDSSDSDLEISSSVENLTGEDRFVMCNTLRQEPQGQENVNKSAHSSYNTLIIHGGPKDEHRLSSSSGMSGYISKRSASISPSFVTHKDHRSYDRSVSEITNIPDDYLSQSYVLKHLAKEVKVPHGGGGTYKKCPSTLEKNPYKEGKNRRKEDISLHYRVYKSKSHPDLSNIHRHKGQAISNTIAITKKEQKYIQMIDRLFGENNNLKIELENCYLNAAKAAKLEQEVSKVYRAHQDLVESCERREKLERSARSKLQTEVRRLQDANRGLRDQTDALTKQLIAARMSNGSGDGVELAKRDAIIAQLVAQNKEFVATKDRQEIELSAQRVMLEEQRTHIDILDTALTNAQTNVVRLEEECRKKQMHVDRVAQLQRALSSLQLASDKREQTERKLRLQLENELRMERSRRNKTCQNLGDGGDSLPELKRKMRERDEKIMLLEGEVAKWEQRYLEESELRQAAIDAASIPKDAKIAALEKTSQESEKIIAEARTDKLRQMDEVHAAQKKVSDLESRMKELESKLAERDAMIKVLQKKHAFEKDNSYDGDPVSTTSVFSKGSSVLTSSTGFSSSASFGGSMASFTHRGSANKYGSSNQSFDQKSLDDQLKELDSQLLSKRGLCCFPGFSHPGAVPRKGKAPEPLLASVKGGKDLTLFEPATALFLMQQQQQQRCDDDVLLLEKQGLCSQAHRQDGRGGSLPPSSLPRPKRHRKSAAKLGEYGRLSDSEIVQKEGSDSRTMKEYRLSDIDRGKSTPPSSPKRETSIPRRFEYPKEGVVEFCPSRGESPKRYAQPGYEYKPPDSPKTSRESPSRMFAKWGDYNKLKIADNERKVLAAKEATAGKSFIPAPKKLEFFQRPEHKAVGPNVESKLRIFSPGGVPGRRGSLQRDPSKKEESGVRSLPTPNKYRIHF